MAVATFEELVGTGTKRSVPSFEELVGDKVFENVVPPSTNLEPQGPPAELRTAYPQVDPAILKQVEAALATPAPLEPTQDIQFTEIPQRRAAEPQVSPKPGIIEQIGIREIGQGIREMVSPTTQYTREESDAMAGEIGDRLKWMLTYTASLGGHVGPKGLRDDLLRQSEAFKGFGPASVKAAGDAETMAVEWGIVYPKLFAAAGMGSEAIKGIPKVKQGMDALKSIGGIKALTTKYPRLMNSIGKTTGAAAKGAVVGGTVATAEVIGKDMSPGGAIRHISTNAAIMAGVAGTFQAASEVDTARWVKSYRNSLLDAHRSHYDLLLEHMDNMKPGSPKGRAIKGLASHKIRDLKAIDLKVARAEADLRGIKTNKLYQEGQEGIETPDVAASRAIESLKIGLGKSKPFIEMQTTRTAEAIEAIRGVARTPKAPAPGQAPGTQKPLSAAQIGLIPGKVSAIPPVRVSPTEGEPTFAARAERRVPLRTTGPTIPLKGMPGEDQPVLPERQAVRARQTLSAEDFVKMTPDEQADAVKKIITDTLSGVKAAKPPETPVSGREQAPTREPRPESGVQQPLTTEPGAVPEAEAKPPVTQPATPKGPEIAVSRPLARDLRSAPATQKATQKPAPKAAEAKVEVNVTETKEATIIEDIEATPRGTGAGTKAIQGLIEKADATRKPIILTVGASNTKAQALYERLGFEEIGRTEQGGIQMKFTPAPAKATSKNAQEYLELRDKKSEFEATSPEMKRLALAERKLIDAGIMSVEESFKPKPETIGRIRALAQPAPKAPKKKRLVSDEALEVAKKRLRDKGTMRMGVDPQGFIDIVTVGVGHFERGLTKFRAWSKQMIKDFGQKIKPELKSIWKEVRVYSDPDLLQVKQAIKKAKLLTPEVKEKQRKERRRRVGQLAGQLKSGLGKPGRAEAAIGKATGALKGPLTEYKGIYESIRTPDNANAIDNAFRSIGESPTLTPLGKVSTYAAFQKLVDGDALTIGDAMLLEQHFGRSWGDLLRSRIPRGDRLWLTFVEALNVPRTLLASGDVSGIGRQARPLGQIEPKLFAQMVGKYHKAFWSQQAAEALELATKQLPYYQEAKDDGILELPEWGMFSTETIEREERFAGAQMAERWPGIGRVVLASERSFVTALNWFRTAVYSQIRTQQAIDGNKGGTKESRAKIAHRINDLSGRSHIKRTAAAKAMQPLLNTLFSARFTLSRFKPIVTLPADAVRSLRQGKLSTELKLGAGALMSLAATNLLIMYLIKLAGDDDEVETEFDLRATNGGKLKIGPMRIDLWSGYLQPAQLMTRLATGERKSAAGSVYKADRTQIMVDFGRSKLNPQSGLVVDAWTGETFIGDRLGQAPDPKRGFGKVMTGIGIPPWVQGVAKEAWNRMMFLSVQDTIDAYVDSGTAMAATAGMLAFSGTGVTTYLPRASTQLKIEQNKLAQSRYGKPWDNLSERQQKALSRNKALRDLEQQKKVERGRQKLDLSFMTKEINAARDRMRRELPASVQKELDALGVTISVPSRHLGGFRLNDKRYEYYQSEVIKELKKRLPAIMRSKITPRGKAVRVEKTVAIVKERVRKKLRYKIARKTL